MPRPKGIPKTGGRKKGEPNKVTARAREAIAMLVEAGSGRMLRWLDEIERTKGAEAAWRCMVDVIEYHVPKLQRTEHTGKDGERLEIVWPIPAPRVED